MREMVEGRDGEGRRMAEGGDYHCEGRRMAEGGDCHGQGRSMAEGGDCRRSMAEGLDATASQDCGPEEGVYTSQGQSRPPFGMSSNYVEGNNAPQSMPPHSMPLVYPSQTSFQELLRGTSAVQLSQASYSPGDSYVNGHPWKACTKQ